MLSALMLLLIGSCCEGRALMQAEVWACLQLASEISCRIGGEQEASNPVNYPLHVCR